MTTDALRKTNLYGSITLVWPNNASPTTMPYLQEGKTPGGILSLEARIPWPEIQM
jgi:hypothetical protein